MRYPLENDIGDYMKKVMDKLMVQLLKELNKYEELQTQDLSITNVKSILSFLRKKLKSVSPIVENRLRRYIRLTFKRGINDAANQTNTPRKLLPSDVKPIRELEYTWVNAFKSLTTEMKMEVQKVVSQGISDRRDPSVIRKQIKNLFERDEQAIKTGSAEKGIRYKNRASMIARSMIVEGYNVAREQRDKQSGVIWGGQWITSDDERTCPICGGRDKDGKVVNNNPLADQYAPLDGYFETTYRGKTYRVKRPPVHINCRCRRRSITYVQAKRLNLL